MSLQWEITQTKHIVGLDTRAEKFKTRLDKILCSLL